MTSVPLEHHHRTIYVCSFQFWLFCGFQVREAEPTHSQRKWDMRGSADTPRAGSPNSANPAWQRERERERGGNRICPSDCFKHPKARQNTPWPESKRTIPTEQPPLFGEVSANFCGLRVPRGQRDGSLGCILGFLDRSSSSVVLTRLSGPCSRSTTSQKIG
jgi:hypothetical protein